MTSWIQGRGDTTDWQDVTTLTRLSVQTVQVNSLYQLKILPCLVNGILCGTAFFAAAAWKLNWLKETRDFVEKGGGGLADDVKRAKIKQYDQEKADILGKDLKKSWNVLKANLEYRRDSIKSIISSTAGPESLTGWNKQLREIEELLNNLITEGPPN